MTRPLNEWLGVLLLGIPVCLFNIFWCSVPLAIAAVAASLLAMVFAFVHTPRAALRQSPMGSDAGLLLVLLLLTALLGVGGLWPSKWDWEKHLMVADQLSLGPWPPSEAVSDGFKSPLVYYFSFYILPAILGRITGPLGMAVGFCLLVATGCFLIVHSLSRLLGSRSLWLVALGFLVFSPLDYLGILFKGHVWFPHREPQWNMGSHIPPFHGTIDMIAWLPQALLPMLALPLLIRSVRDAAWLVPAMCATAFAVAWSPVSSAGLLLGLAYCLAKHPMALKSRMVLATLAASFLAALPQIMYLWMFANVGKTPSQIPDITFPDSYIMAVVLTLGPWIFLATRSGGQLPQGFLLVMLISLLPPAFIRLGALTDFQMKFVIPAVFCLMIYSMDISKSRPWIALPVFALGALSAFVQLGNAFADTATHPIPLAKRSYYLMNELPEDFVNVQYLGRLPSPAARVLFRVPNEVVKLLHPSRRAVAVGSGLRLEAPPGSTVEFIVRSETPNGLFIFFPDRPNLEFAITKYPQRVRLSLSGSSGEMVLFSERDAFVSHIISTGGKDPGSASTPQ